MSIPSKSESLSRKINYHLRSHKTSIDNSNILTTSPTVEIKSKPKLFRIDNPNKEELNLNDNPSFREENNEKIEDNEFTMLTKKETIKKKKSFNKQFSNFKDKYEYYSNTMINDIGDLINQYKNELNSSDNNEEKQNAMKKMKDDRELFKRQISELKGEIFTRLEKYNKLKAKIKQGVITEKGFESSPFSKQLMQLSEINTLLDNKKKGFEKEIKILSVKIKSERDEKKNLMSIMTIRKFNPSSYSKTSKFDEIESIEREIMEYKINSMKKELALKDKQIKILREKNCLHNLADPSDESSNNADIVEELNNSYLNFEEEFNVTNNSNESNGPVNDSDNYEHSITKKREYPIKNFIQRAERPIYQNSNAFMLDNEFKLFNKSRELVTYQQNRGNNKSSSISNQQISQNTSKGPSINNLNTLKPTNLNIKKEMSKRNHSLRK